MERRFRVRLGELRDDAEVRPGLLRGLAPRLEAFLSYCEGVYAGGLDAMSWATSAHHIKRIELAHRNLMAACRTLAKVRRAKLPDVFAVVNVALTSRNPETATPG